MKPALIVVPLTGEFPFLLTADSWNALLLEAEKYDRTQDYYVIDPCNRAVFDAQDASPGDVGKFDFIELLTKEEMDKRKAEETKPDDPVTVAQVQVSNP